MPEKKIVKSFKSKENAKIEQLRNNVEKLLEILNKVHYNDLRVCSELNCDKLISDANLETRECNFCGEPYCEKHYKKYIFQCNKCEDNYCCLGKDECICDCE